MGNNVVPLRRPAGTPVGGQFAPTTRDEAEVVLESPVPSAFDLPDGSVWSHWTDDGEADAIVTDREGVGSGIVRALDAEQWHTSDGRTAHSWSASADGRQIGSGIVTDPEEATMFVSSALDRAERGIKDEWESGYGPTAASWASREDLTLFVNHFRHDDVGWTVSRDGIEIACGDSTDSVSARLAATQAANQVRDGWYPPSDGYSALEPMTLGEFQRNGDGQYTTVVGPKYTNEWRKPSEIAAAVRNDIKEAVAAGQLPSEVNGHTVNYSVRSRSKGTSAVDVTVHGIRDADQTEPQPEGNYSR